MRGRTLRAVLVKLIVAACVLVMLVPVYYMIVVASAPFNADVSSLRFHGFHLLQNVRFVLDSPNAWRSLVNSLIMAVSIGVLDALLAGAAGYAIAQLRFPGRRPLFVAVIALLALSPVMVIIPQYIIMVKVHWLDSYQALIVPAMVSALGVFLVRQFALAIPGALLHAARVDGASEWRIFLRVALPLLRPALLTLFLLDFLVQWDNLLWPLIVSNDPSYWTFPVLLASNNGQYGTAYNLIAAGALIYAIPPLVIIIVLQRYYVRGLTLGAFKG
jgi:multiple sugar transport system permease protein